MIRIDGRKKDPASGVPAINYRFYEINKVK